MKRRSGRPFVHSSQLGTPQFERAGVEHLLRAMATESEVQKKGHALSGVVECLGRLAADSAATTMNRLEAIDLLLRLAIGPRNRPADSIDAVASRNARFVLSDTASFLDETMVSNNRARIRLHAASLARFVSTMSDCAGSGSRPDHE